MAVTLHGIITSASGEADCAAPRSEQVLLRREQTRVVTLVTTRVCVMGCIYNYFFGGTSSTISTERTQSVFPSPTEMLSIPIRTSTLSSAGGRMNEMVPVFQSLA